MAENCVKGLPDYKSLDELIEFFDTHDLGDEIAQMPEVDFDVNIKKRVYLITLGVELAEKDD